MVVHSFEPIVGGSPTHLLLGSMPGKASLLANQYYAHPRNLFWPMMEQVIGVKRELSYEQRCHELVLNKIALWDVLKTCTRSSSLDSDIVEASIVVNDITGLLKRHPTIKTICFNGAKAEQSFSRYVIPGAEIIWADYKLIKLPSTSPANASIPLSTKQLLWSEALIGVAQ